MSGRHALVLALEYAPGTLFSGNGTYARCLVRSIASHYNQITVLCGSPPSSLSTTTTTTTISNNNIHIQTIPLPKWYTVDASCSWSTYASGVAAQLKKQPQPPYDIIISVCWSGVAAYEQVRNIMPQPLPPMIYFNLKVFGHAHAHSADERAIYHRFESFGCQHARRVVVLSECDLKLMQRMYAFDITSSSPAIIINPPLRAEIHALAINTHQQHHHRSFVLCCCRIHREKHIRTFVRSVCMLSKRLITRGYIPVICGAVADEEYARELRTILAEKYRVVDSTDEAKAGDCVMMGFLASEHLCELFKRTCVNVHPSTYEAYGMTIIEAASFGAVSIVHNNHMIGAIDRVRPDHEVLVADMSRHESIAHTLESILLHEADDNPPRLHSMSQSAQKAALSYGEQEYAAQVMQALS